jgi:transmembrane sensor
MSGLPLPVKDVLRKTTTAASVTRMWNRIEARGRVDAGRRMPRRFPLVAVAVLLVSVAGWSLYARRPPAEVPVSPGPASVEGARAPRTGHALLPPPPLEQEPQEPQPQAAEVVSPPAARAPTRPAASVAASPVWRELARRGDNVGAYAELGPGGVARAARSAQVEDLFALADVARLSGHPADAVEPLERVVAEYPSDPRAPLAAFTIGRVELESLAAPGAAARAFEQALALGIPGGLAEDAYVYLAEARARSGDRAGAARAYQDYGVRFPGGRRAPDVRRWTTDPER